MEKTPAEILHLIIGHLGTEPAETALESLVPKLLLDLSGYASISRRWQLAIEERTFRSIKLTTARFGEALKILNKERYRHLRRIKFHLDIVPETTASRPKYTSEEEDRFSAIFTRFIDTSFSFLSAAPLQNLNLDLELFVALKRSNLRDWPQIDEQGHDCPRGLLVDYSKDIDSLGEFNNIAGLWITSSFECIIHPTVPIRLASRMPLLTVLDMFLIDPSYSPKQMAELRQNMAAALSKLRSPLSAFSMYLDNRHRFEADSDGENSTAADRAPDCLSEAVKRISMLPSLREIHIYASLELSIFQVNKDDKNSLWSVRPDSWENLKTFSVTFSEVSPSQDCLLHFDYENYSGEDELLDQRCWRIKDEVANECLECVITAVKYMPKLEEFKLTVMDDKGLHISLCESPFQPEEWEIEICCLWWFMPSQTMLQSLLSTSKSVHGATELFVDVQCQEEPMEGVETQFVLE